MNPKQVIIDVREPSEYERGHVSGAFNIPSSELMAGSKQLGDVPKDTQLIVYCLTGSRSNASIQILKQIGFTNLVNGINAGHVEKSYLNNIS